MCISLCAAADSEAEGPIGDVVPSAPGGGQGSSWRSVLHGLPVLRAPRDQAATYLTHTHTQLSVSQRTALFS